MLGRGKIDVWSTVERIRPLAHNELPYSRGLQSGAYPRYAREQVEKVDALSPELVSEFIRLLIENASHYKVAEVKSYLIAKGCRFSFSQVKCCGDEGYSSIFKCGKYEIDLFKSFAKLTRNYTDHCCTVGSFDLFDSSVRQCLYHLNKLVRYDNRQALFKKRTDAATVVDKFENVLN